MASPVLTLSAAAILLEDGRPIFFSQRRVGRFGEIFTIHKLRTMKKINQVDALSPRNAKDSRITRVGRVLRKTSIDELPQLLNVLRGEMALVGPRPEMPFIVNKYENWQHLRHLVTPGITGLWQVTARKTIALEKPEATMIDLEYIRTVTLLNDVKILLKTILAIIRPKGAF